MSSEAVVNRLDAGCCVVGGGPAGAIAALLLARRGVDVVLLEAHHDFDREFRGDTILPAMLEVLDEIGLAEKLHALPHVKVHGPVFQTSRGPVRPVDLRRLTTKFPYIMFMHQPYFLEFLIHEARQYPTFRLMLGAQVQQLVEEDGAVRGVRYRADDGWHEVRALVTLGCDGRFSTLRRLGGFTAVQTSQTLELLWFRLPRLPEDPEESKLLQETGLGPSRESSGAFGSPVMGRLGRGRIMVIINRADHWQVGYFFPPGQYKAIHEGGVAELRKSVAEIEPHFAPHMEHLTDWKQVSLLSVASNRCRTWHKPGLLLIGDAAHTMTPVGGAGIKYAFEDAVVAANVLAGPILAGHVEQRDLARVQREREWPTRAIQLFAAFAVRQVLWMLQLQGTPRVPWFVPLMLRTPLVTWFVPRLVGVGLWRVHVEPRQG